MGNPRTCLGNNIVIVPFLAGGVVWYVAHQSGKSMVGILSTVQQLRDTFVLFSSIRPS
jgi:hypothetical protein